MNRRTLLINSGKAVAGAAACAVGVKASPQTSTVTFRVGSTSDFFTRDAKPDHKCSDDHLVQAECLARNIISDTGKWKEEIGRLGPMVVTHCGHAACEISLPEGKHHPDWQFTRRVLTAHEQTLFRVEYGRSHWLLTAAQFGSIEVRGFIFNGRRPGWNLSTQAEHAS